MKGYKYREIDLENRNLNMLFRNEIYASPFSKLNDPNEAIYDENITQTVNLLSSMFNVDSSEILNCLKDIESYKSNLGIYSLSTDYSINEMWSKYGDCHKGFCIEYDIEKLKDLYLSPAAVNQLKVTYSKPQTLTILDIQDQKKQLVKLFGTKTKDWSYENEVRLIFDSYGLKNYHPSALLSIYFGTEMKEICKKQIIDKLSDRDVRFFDMIREGDNKKLKFKLIHKNKRVLNYNLSEFSYEILYHKNTPLIETYNILYKSQDLDESTLIKFANAFKEKFAVKACNINLYDDVSVSKLINKYPLESREYVDFAEHFIGAIYMNKSDVVNFYPNKDFQYDEFKKSI
jgi:hypothetical protein